ncbi:hypothetical protein PTET_a2582 [Pseudoalteromonas tetraodonis]|nr:hypothetical protein PTET_a2582 [Pseudoalteromonas tetraodonis]
MAFLSVFQSIKSFYCFFKKKAKGNFITAVNLIRTELEQIFIVMALG